MPGLICQGHFMMIDFTAAVHCGSKEISVFIKNNMKMYLGAPSDLRGQPDLKHLFPIF